MTERELESDLYWSDVTLLGEVPFPDGDALVRLWVHQSGEPFHDRNIAELIQLHHPTGSRTYIHAKPYVLAPEITLALDLFPTPHETGAVGQVVASDWEGMHHVEIGQAHAWYYAPDRLLVL